MAVRKQVKKNVQHYAMLSERVNYNVNCKTFAVNKLKYAKSLV